ncbi:MAG TPA: VOC family protein [Candidatus Thermoplasmatota archaeon]|nr:VOC family protein [Candidatus Thermoplasmatota archaeon]
MAQLPDATRIGAVHLNVRDIERALLFYCDTLGLRERRRDATSAELGSDSTFLHLHATPDARPRAPNESGLYHVAYLLPSRADLGRVIRHLAAARYPLQGASDHAVSEALYLADPEGNGIEIYADRPRDAWPRAGERIQMATDVMDVESVLAAGGEARWVGAPDGMRVGHVHLNVNDVPAAEAFYRERVGFDLVTRYGARASFLSAGGYHHHVAVNAWGTHGGPAARPATLGLRRFNVVVPREGYEDALERLGGEEAADPAGNRFRITLPEATS